jgi:hypothetical protein
MTSDEALDGVATDKAATVAASEAATAHLPPSAAQLPGRRGLRRDALFHQVLQATLHFLVKMHLFFFVCTVNFN